MRIARMMDSNKIYEKLNTQEAKVYDLSQKGLSVADIAKAMQISRHTVKSHMAKIERIIVNICTND